MHRLAKPLLIAAALLAPGCGDGNEVVTDPKQLKPLTDEQKKGVREADDQIAAEENANPTKPVKGSGKGR